MIKYENNDYVVYAFTTPKDIESSETNGRLAIKVGDTMRGISEGLSPVECAWTRMNEYKTSDSKKKILVGTWVVNKSLINRDYDLHEIFKMDGRRPAELDGGDEWFYFDKDIAVAKQEIESVIESFGQTARAKITLRSEQKRTLDEAARIAYDTNSKRVDIAANLSPRFGKTIWALMLFRRFCQQLNHDTMILPASWLSSQTSFESELEKYREFENMEFINTMNPGWETKMNDAYTLGKKVVVAVSLHTPNKYKLKALRDVDNGYKFVCIDEGDFGAWTPSSRAILDYITGGKKNTGKLVVMPMSGTNIARMVTGAEKMDGVVQSTYTMLEQTEKNIVPRTYVRLRLTETDKYIQELSEDEYFSFVKLWSNVTKNQNAIFEIFDGLLGKTNNQNYVDLSLSNVMDEFLTGAMFWTSATVKELNKLKVMLESRYPEYRWVFLNGDETTNRDSEVVVRTAINEAKYADQKGVMVVSRAMGSRSFSIPEIQTSVLLYDRGGIDPTIQKSARCLTPGKKWDGEIKSDGYIVSMSVDPNRDDMHFRALVQEAAVQTEITGESLPEVFRQLLRNVSFLDIDTYGNVVELTHDVLIEELTSSETVQKVAAALSNPMAVIDDPELMEILMGVEASKGNTKKIQKLLPDAKNFITTGLKKHEKSAKSIERELLKRIDTLVGSSAMVSLMGPGETYRECLMNIDDVDGFAKTFGATPDDVITLLDYEVLPEHLLDIVVANSESLIDVLGKTTDKTEVINILEKFQNMKHIGTYREMGITGNSSEAQLWAEKISEIKWDKTSCFLTLATGMGYEVTEMLKAGIEIDKIDIQDKSGFARLWQAAGFTLVEI